MIVVAAPGYPGTPAEAQPSMDSFAASVAKAAGLPEGSLQARYENTEQDGVSRLKEKSAAMAETLKAPGVVQADVRDPDAPQRSEPS